MKTLVIKDIKGNVYAYSGKQIEYVEFKHASQIKIPKNTYTPLFMNTQEYLNAFGQTIQKIKDADDPTRILLEDGTGWYTEHSIEDIDFNRLENDVVEIDRCFSINTFYDGHDDD